MSTHLRAAWRKLAQVRVTPGSPLGYNMFVTHRLSLHGDTAEKMAEPYKMMPPTGYAYFDPYNANPRMNIREPAPADLIAFVDLNVGPQVWIAYLAVRPDHRGEGLARKLMEAVYDQWPDKDVHWGKLMHAAMGHLYQSFRQTHPERTFGGSVRY